MIDKILDPVSLSNQIEINIGWFGAGIDESEPIEIAGANDD